MTVEKARNGEVELAYTTLGPADGTPLLLLMGAGGQWVMWPEGFLRALVDRGFRVALMDNRDTGLSSHLHQYDWLTRKQRPAYTLWDMADDVIAVFDALGWAGGHVAGVSLGGMIAQAVAIRHPDRVRSLTSISSQPTASPLFARPHLPTMLRMMRAVRGTSRTPDEEGEKWVRLFKVLESPAYPVDEAHWREAGRRAFERGLNPKGDLRNFLAVRATGDRRPRLANLRCPALVIHGKADRLGSWRAGRATADAIPGAKFVLYPDMSHELAGALWPAVTDEIRAVAALADGVRQPRGEDTPRPR